MNTITLPRAVVEQALDALNVLNYECFIRADQETKLESAIASLRAALDAPQPEPVACAEYNMIDHFLRCNLNSDADYAEYSAALDRLCATPPPNPLSYEQADTMLKAREVKP